MDYEDVVADESLDQLIKDLTDIDKVEEMVQKMVQNGYLADILRSMGDGDWIETDPCSIPYGKAVADAVAAIRDHVPSMKIFMHCGDVPRKCKIEGLPKPCPWVDDMAYDTVVSCSPLSRDQFRDLFQSFHLAIISPEQLNNMSLEHLLAPLIIRSRNPFHEDDGIFGQICEDYTGPKRVVDPPKWDNSSLLDKIRSSASRSAISTGLDDCGDSGSTVRIDDLAFHQWYMDDSNFDDAQAYFCLSALVMLTAAVSVPQQVQKDLQSLLAQNYSKYSFRKAPPCFAKISKKSAERICQKVNWRDLMGTVLMIFDREKYPDRKTSDRERSFLDYLQKTAENGSRFDLCRFIERAAEDLEVPVSMIGQFCSKDWLLNDSWKHYSDAKKLIEFYKKAIPYERDGRVHTFKYWAFAPFLQGACFNEILKKRNLKILPFCIGLSDPKHKSALKMTALKGKKEVESYYELGLQKRAEIRSKSSNLDASKGLD